MSRSPGRRLRMDAVAARLAACAILCALGASSLVPERARAGTYTVSIQPLSTVTRDGYLREDNPTEKNTGKPEIDLQASNTARNWNVVIDIPATGLAGRTI